MAVKAGTNAATSLLIAGYENSGKSTLGATIKDGLVVNCDHKAYVFNVPHCNYSSWKGIQDFKNFVNGKVKAYKEKFGKLPKIVVIDTITHLALTMDKYYSEVYKNDKFKVYAEIKDDTTELGQYVQWLNEQGINVVIMAHTVFDTDTNRMTIPASGAFKKAGGWISFVSEAIFIERTADNHQIVLKDSGVHIVRSVMPEIMNSKEQEIRVDFDKFSINEHFDKILNARTESKGQEL